MCDCEYYYTPVIVRHAIRHTRDKALYPALVSSSHPRLELESSVAERSRMEVAVFGRSIVIDLKSRVVQASRQPDLQEEW